MSKIDFKIDGIGKFIKENKFCVPSYQRPYSWESEKHTLDLFYDIENNLSEEEYFLGTIVLTKNETGRLEIVDGQQRLTTILLFYAAIRDIFSEDSKDKKIQVNYLSDYDRREDKEIPKLNLNEYDNDFYREFIVNKNLEYLSKSKSNELIKDSYFLIYEKLKQNSYNEKTLLDLMDFIDEKLKIVIITVSEETNAFTIFETLNDRGLVLAQIDLLKNYLYSKCSNNTILSNVRHHWHTLSIKMDERKLSLIEYIRAFWLANYAFIRTKDNQIFKALKDKIKNAEVQNFVLQLSDDSDLFIAIQDENHVYWKENGLENCAKYIKLLNYLELTQYYPLIFSIMKNFESDIEKEKALKLVLSWMVRMLIVGSNKGGTVEQSYSKNALKIKKKEIRTAKQLRDNLISLIPDDETFKNAFSTATLSKEKLSRFYLREIEHYKTKDNLEKEVPIDVDKINLEHILPQNSENNYPNFSTEEHTKYLKRIGNLTLMNTKSNNKQKSASFEDKKVIFKESTIEITKSVADYSEWSVENIEKRQNELAETAVKVWTIKFD